MIKKIKNFIILILASIIGFFGIKLAKNKNETNKEEENIKNTKEEVDKKDEQLQQNESKINDVENKLSQAKDNVADKNKEYEEMKDKHDAQLEQIREGREDEKIDSVNNAVDSINDTFSNS